MSRTPSPQRHTHGPGPCTAWRALALGWLLAALLVAPSLGLLHRVVHEAWAAAELARPGPDAVGATAAAVHDPAHDDAPHSHPHMVPVWLERLFGAHDQAGECRLFDQLSSSLGAPVAALVAGTLPLPPQPPCVRAAAPACRVFLRGYHARAPPMALAA